jgi:small subunit ribosomal protein S16
MATRIRLQRHGKKGKPFFHLVAADSRAKRDGKFIEKLGTYNPTANPAIIDINFENTLAWVQTGAEMSNTARAILSYKGVLYKNHLLNGVKKGALTAEQVEEKFAKWLSDKEAKIQGKKDGLAKNATAEKAAKLKAEQEANAAKAAEVAAKITPEVEVAEEVETDVTNADENVSEESTEATHEETTEVVAEEAQEETAQETVAEEAQEAPAQEPVAEVTEEDSKEDAPAETQSEEPEA